MRRPRTARLAGYVLAEALVSAAIASLTATLAIGLLVWAARAVDLAQSDIGAMRVLERVYEEARLATPAELARTRSGVLGRYQWSRSAGPPLESKVAYAPMPIHLQVQWTVGGRLQRRRLEALVRPGGEAAAP